jgi:hypothetical protein
MFSELPERPRTHSKSCNKYLLVACQSPCENYSSITVSWDPRFCLSHVLPSAKNIHHKSQYKRLDPDSHLHPISHWPHHSQPFRDSTHLLFLQQKGHSPSSEPCIHLQTPPTKTALPLEIYRFHPLTCLSGLTQRPPSSPWGLFQHPIKNRWLYMLVIPAQGRQK